MDQESDSGKTPYKGLEPFTEDDARIFFGRNEVRDRLVYSLQSSRLTVLYGARQIGKTSLLRAGVINQLCRRSASIPPESAVVFFDDWSGQNLIRDISIRINKELERVGIEERPDPETESFAKCCEKWARCVGNLFLVLDRFEDHLFFQSQIKTEPGSFDFEFSKAISTRGLAMNFLVAIRDDVLASFDRYRPAMANLSSLIRLEALTKDHAQEAIQNPVYETYNAQHEGAKIGIEAELVWAVLKAVMIDGSQESQVSCEPDALSGGHFDSGTLQLAMKAVWQWETSNGSRTLRLGTFKERLKGIAGIAGDRVEEAYKALSKREQNLTAKILDHLITPGGTGLGYQLSDLTRRVGVAETEIRALTDKLRREGILVAVAPGKSPDSVRYEVAHRIFVPAVINRVQRHFEDKNKEEHRLRLEIEKSLRLFSQTSQLDALKTMLDAGQTWSVEAKNLSVSEQLGIELRNTLQRMLESLAQKGQLGGYKGAVSSIAYNRKGNLIVTGAEDGSLTLWDLRLPEPSPAVYRDKHKTWIWALRSSVDGSSIATGSDDGTVGLWDISDDGINYRRSISLAADRDAAPLVRGLSFNHHGSLLAISGTDGKVRLWELKKEKIVHEFIASTAAVRCVEFDPTGERLATGDDNGEIAVWDLEGKRWNPDDGRGDFSFKHDRAVWGIRFHPDGKRLASCSEDHSIRFWDLKSGRVLQTLIGHTCWVLGIRFNSDGTLLASASEDGTARLWDQGGNEVSVFMHGAPVNGVCFSPDDMTLATAAADCKIRLWNVRGKRDQECPKTFRHRDKDILMDVSFSCDGKSVAVGATDSKVQIWNQHGQPERILQGHKGWIMCVAFHPSEPKSIATGSIDGTARVWNFVEEASEPQFEQFIPLDGPIWSLAFSPDGRTLATGSSGGMICAWNLELAKSPPVVRTQSGRGSVWSIRFSPDGKWIAAGCQDGSILIREFGGTEVKQLAGVHEGQVLSLSFSPDGKFLASASSEGKLCVWGFGGAVRKKWSKHLDAPIWSVSFSPQGKVLATGSVDRRVCLWSTVGEQLGEYYADGPIRGLAFSRDGKWLAAACSDGTLRLWPTRKEALESLLGRANSEWKEVRSLVWPHRSQYDALSPEVVSNEAGSMTTAGQAH